MCPTFIVLMTDKIIPFNFKSSCLEDPGLSYVAIFRGYSQVHLPFHGNPPAERHKGFQTGISDSFTSAKPSFFQWPNLVSYVDPLTLTHLHACLPPPWRGASQSYEAHLGRELNQSSYQRKMTCVLPVKFLSDLLLSPVPCHAYGNRKTARHSPAPVGLHAEMITWYVKQQLLGGGEERVWKWREFEFTEPHTAQVS